MKKKFIKTILIMAMIVSFSGSLMPVKAAVTVDDEGHVLTDISPTEEELEWEKENVNEDAIIELNDLGKERSSKSRALKSALRSSRAVKRAASLTTFASSVDNSMLSAFPEIENQSGFGSCAAFTATYYTMSHMVNLLTGRDGSNLDNVFSPKWTYNVLNRGNGNNGTSMLGNFALIKDIGALSWSDFPYVGTFKPASNYTEWKNSLTSAKKAQKYSIESLSSIDIGVETNPISSPTDSDLTQIKTLLSNGYVLATQTNWNECIFAKVDNDPSTLEDDEYVGEKICKWRDGVKDSTSHAFTIVGYNDNIWKDINEDGVVQPAEKGALKIANSWGKKWGNDGFFWVSYDALNKISQVSNLPAECVNHKEFLHYNMAFWIIPQIKSDVKTYAQFTLKGARREQCSVTLEATNKESNDTITYTSKLLNNNGGKYAFDGGREESYGYFLIDLRNVISGFTPDQIKDYTWTLTVKDNKKDERPIQIALFNIVDEINNNTYVNNTGTSSVNGSSLSFINAPITIDSYTGTYYDENSNNEYKGQATLGSTINFNASASGGNSTLTYQYTIAPRNTIPATYSNESSSGEFNWTPTEAGIYAITVTAKDTAGNVQTKTLYYEINS